MAEKAAARKAKRTGAETAGKKKKVASKTATKKAEPKKKEVAKKKAAPRKARKSGKNVRIKAFWGVFNQNLKRVALFEFNERKKAETRARELSASGKSPHFIQPVKEPVTE